MKKKPNFKVEPYGQFFAVYGFMLNNATSKGEFTLWADAGNNPHVYPTRREAFKICTKLERGELA